MPEGTRCPEKWVASVLGKFMLSKFIDKQVETIHNRFCMLEKTNIRPDHELLGSSNEGRQEMGEKIGISYAVRGLWYWLQLSKGWKS